MSVNLATSTKHIKSTSTYSDWFLPTYLEADKMYTNLKSGTDENSVVYTPVGGFTDAAYWTSRESDATYAWYQEFSGIGGQGLSLKNTTRRVRACRSFTSVSPSYSLRDVGPAGGLIFYKNGNDYFEAAPSDQSATTTWSNIVDQLIGTTSISIGEGQNNTNEIIAQSGHTNSAAKICDDLVV